MAWTLIPAKSFDQAKQRLAGMLDEAARAALAQALLARSIGIAARVPGAGPVLVATHDPAVRDFALKAGADRVVMHPVADLNAELACAAALVPAREALLVLLPDLPFLRADDLAALLAEDAAIAIAPDQRETGTNALVLRGPDRLFAFGPGSFGRHVRAAAARGLVPCIVRREGLAHDLDIPADWQRMEALADPILSPIGD